jgi:hypothetical protein
MKLSDLKPAPYNPRTMTPEAFAGLGVSIEQFGDLSGIVFNRRTMRLVAGHQRVKALREKYGDIEFNADGELITPNGNVFAWRVVDWDEPIEKAANVAANSRLLAGAFDASLDTLLAELDGQVPFFEDLRLNELLEDLGTSKTDRPETDTDPKLSGLVYRIVVTCTDEKHQLELMERFKEQGITCSPLIS